MTTVTVRQDTETVVVTPDSVSFTAIDDTVRLTGTAQDANGNAVSGETLTWSSADTLVATVDGTGLVTAVGNGSVTITAMGGGQSGMTTVTVRQVTAVVVVTPDSVTFTNLGATQQFAAEAQDANANALLAQPQFVWASADPGVATMDASGLVTAVGNGSTSITGTGDGQIGTAAVTVSVDVGKIAFYSNRSGDWDVYVIDADGSNLLNLTNDPALDIPWGWSPDGSKIVFQSTRDGNTEVYVMDADGSNPVNLTNDAAEEIHPSWSPDGSRIVFASDRDSTGNYEIYVMDADGSNPVRLTDTLYLDQLPGWSPDGSKIAFYSYRSAREVYGIYMGSIYVMNADGSNPIELANTLFLAEWSPDGSKIAFSCVVGENGDTDACVIDADGSNLLNLTNDPGYAADPHWSPDGSKIAFTSTRDGNREIYVMDADGSNPVRLTDDGAPKNTPLWSPDGSKIAFIAYRDGNTDLYVINADGSNRVRLTDDPGTDILVSWSPVVGGN